MPQPVHPSAATAAVVSALSADSAVQALPLTPLALFSRRMAYEGWPVDVGRMCLDAAYAYDCLALAHTSSSDELRASALALFNTFERNHTTNAPLH